jgi:hypothetical protein
MKKIETLQFVGSVCLLIGTICFATYCNNQRCILPANASNNNICTGSPIDAACDSLGISGNGRTCEKCVTTQSTTANVSLCISGFENENCI